MLHFYYSTLTPKKQGGDDNFFKLILENENGDQIDMTTTANRYMTSKIDGLYPPAGTISTSTYAGMDGSYLNNAFIEKRNIVILMVYNKT